MLTLLPPPFATQVDARAPTAAAAVWKVTADVEALTWDPSQPTSFLVSTEDGMVVRLDARGGAGEGTGGGQV
jgi:periodic tryptophan protein 1